jgi:hypothetical protein
VGVALQQWICNIENVLEEGKIEIRQPKQPDRDVLNGIDKDRAIILVQFILHRKLNLERLSKIMHSTAPEVERHLEILQRLDFLREKNGVYAINRYLQPLLIDAFEEDLLI